MSKDSNSHACCPVCSSHDLAYRFELRDYYCGLPGTFRMSSCGGCGAFFLNPGVPRTEIGKYYQSSYYSYVSGEGTRRSKLRFANLFYVWNALWDRWNKGNVMGRYLCRNESGNFLDIGCGDGMYLRRIGELNPCMTLFGNDPFSSVPDEAYRDANILFSRKSLDDAGLPSEFFDHVAINHVLEHVDAPHEVMSEIARVLKPDGRLHIGLPNTGSVSRLVFGRYWIGFDSPRHYVDYNRKSLEALLHAHGLKVEVLKYNGNAPHVLQSMEFAIFKQRPRSGLWESKAVQGGLLALLNPLVKILNLFRIGDSFMIEARKG